MNEKHRKITSKGQVKSLVTLKNETPRERKRIQIDPEFFGEKKALYTRPPSISVRDLETELLRIEEQRDPHRHKHLNRNHQTPPPFRPLSSPSPPPHKHSPPTQSVIRSLRPSIPC